MRVTAALAGDAPASAGGKSADIHVNLVAMAPGDAGQADQPGGAGPGAGGTLPVTGMQAGILALLGGLALALVANGIVLVKRRGRSATEGVK